MRKNVIRIRQRYNEDDKMFSSIFHIRNLANINYESTFNVVV